MRASLLISALLVSPGLLWAEVHLVRAPAGSLQPQAATDAQGALHLVYFRGEPAAGDVFYARRDPGAAAFSAPLRVNSQANTAIAIGTVRGPHLALGVAGRPHVAWMVAGGGPGGMYYTRLGDEGDTFEPQRNISRKARALDGGGSLAADTLGHVYIAWHAGDEGEEKRRVWVAHSTDEGRNFATETPLSPVETGACGCCGMRALADGTGRLYLLYRAAAERIHRDMILLVADSTLQLLSRRILQPWELAACPMSTSQLLATPDGALAAWESEGQVYWTRAAAPSARVHPPGEGTNRKHPVVAANARGEILLAWTEGTGWNQGGALAWQVFDAEGKPTAERGRLDDAISVWGSAAATALPDGSFTVIY